MTFIHRFTRRLACTMTVADAPPCNGENFAQNVEWTAQPKPKHRQEYIRWSHTVYSQLSNRWNLRLMHVIEAGPRRLEYWVYAPDEPPKRLR
jgi:hypothetical protein